MRHFLILLGLLFSTAPAFALGTTTVQGFEKNLRDYIGDGRWTLIMIWSLDCGICEQQKPMIDAFHLAHVETDAKVIGLVTDGREDITRIRHRLYVNKPSYLNLIADRQATLAQLSVETEREIGFTPTYIMYTPEGELLGVRVGPFERQQLEAVVAP